jgi:hypothetical protein
MIAGLNVLEGERLVVRSFLPKQVRVEGSFTISDGGRLEFGLDLNAGFDYSPWSSTITFEPNIPVHLGGTLALTFDAGMRPASGSTFDLFDWTGVEPTGVFIVASPYLWDLTNLYSTGEVRLTGTGGVADYDQSGVVDQGDLDLVLLNWGIKHFENGLSAPVGWTNDLPIGPVDQDDLDKVLLNWGRQSTAGLPAASVPEPSAAALLVASGLAAWICGARRRKAERD